MNLHEIVSLDELNMAPIITELGEAFSFNWRMAKLKEELLDGAKIISYHVSDMLVAYAQYKFKTKEQIHFLSMQVHPDFRGGLILMNLIKKVLKALKREKYKTIVSSVHVNNEKSILFHLRLGFSETERSENRIKFQITKQKLETLLTNNWL